MQTQRRARRAWQYAAGTIGCLVGWAACATLLFFLTHARFESGWEEVGPGGGLLAAMISIIIGGVTGLPIGAVAGVTMVSRLLKQKGSFWKALAGAIAGLLIGGFLAGLLLGLSSSFGAHWRIAEAFTAIVAIVGFTLPLIGIVIGAVIGYNWRK